MNENELRVAFEARRPALQKLGEWTTEVICAELVDQLGSPVAVEKFLQIPPKPRVKETDSFLEKALIRKRKTSPLTEITDQVGVRFVVLLLEDIDRIGSIVKSDRWLWQKDRDHEQERLEKPDYFAYQSDHYVITTINPIDYGGMIIPPGFSCEIQIRTILQHAYAEMAHSSDYKPSIHLPEEDKKRVKRSLAKGSALIETTDEVFREIKNRLHEYSESVEALLVASSDIYSEMTGEKTNPDTQLSQIIGDAYREILKDTSPAKLEEWADEHKWLGGVLVKKRNESVFYRDSIVIIIGWLITEHPLVVACEWPVDGSYLEDLFVTLGVSTVGIF
jgi:ppGpp synthetase/RelA/SpoT-type nucleotidyltranferase